MLTKTERDRMAMQFFPFQLTVQSDDGTYSTHGGYTSKSKAESAARGIFKFDAYNKKPIRVVVHHAETGRLVINRKRPKRG